MGGYYARAEGLPDAVADAIRDHYKPVGQGDDVPTAPATVAVALADKLDTLFSFFAVDERPTGSKDPFALRRASLGILALQVQNGLRWSIEGLYRGWSDLSQYDWLTVADGLEQVRYFFADRLKVQQREAGVRHDLIDAVFALGGEDDLVRLLARVHALQAFVNTEDGTNLLAGYKRAANILKKESWSPNAGSEGEGVVPATGEEDPLVLVDDPEFRGIAGEFARPDKNYDREPAEQALIDALKAAEPQAERAIEGEEFTAAMAALASLRAPIDAFFESVTVNDADANKRASRLALLDRFRAAVHKVADFSRIEG